MEAPEWVVVLWDLGVGRVWSPSSSGPACGGKRLPHGITAEDPHPSPDAGIDLLVS